MCATFAATFFLGNFFQLKTPKRNKTLEWGMDERFKYAELYAFISYARFLIYIRSKAYFHFLLVAIHDVLLKANRLY